MPTASLASPTQVPGTQTLERSFALLRAIAAAGEAGATLDELCAECGASSSTTYRLLQALRQQGFVRPGAERGRHVLGYELFALGAQAGNPGGLIRWPVWLALPVGFTLLMLQGWSELIKRIAFLRGAGPDPTIKHGEKTAEEELAEVLRERSDVVDPAAAPQVR